MMKRGRGRVLVVLVLWLGIGLALAVVSAMGIDVRDQRSDFNGRSAIDEPAPSWPETPPAGWPAARFTQRWENFGITLIVGEGSEGTGPAYTGYVMVARRVGWPWLALKCWTLSTRTGLPPPARTEEWELWSLTLPRTFGVSYYSGGSIGLPLCPILPGLLVNTLFFTALVWVPFYGVGFVRCANRRKRGRCVGCGYDLRGSAGAAVCPECGRGVLGAVQT